MQNERGAIAPERRCAAPLEFHSGQGSAQGHRIPLAIGKEDAMAKSSNWQEEGTSIGGVLLDEEDALAIVGEVRRRVKDQKILDEIECFLTNGEPLSERTRDALQLVIMGIMMQWNKRHRK